MVFTSVRMLNQGGGVGPYRSTEAQPPPELRGEQSGNEEGLVTNL